MYKRQGCVWSFVTNTGNNAWWRPTNGCKLDSARDGISCKKDHIFSAKLQEYAGGRVVIGGIVGSGEDAHWNAYGNGVLGPVGQLCIPIKDSGSMDLSKIAFSGSSTATTITGIPGTITRNKPVVGRRFNVYTAGTGEKVAPDMLIENTPTKLTITHMPGSRGQGDHEDRDSSAVQVTLWPPGWGTCPYLHGHPAPLTQACALW